MLKKNSSLALAVLVLHLMLWLPLSVSAQSNSDPKIIKRIKTAVVVIGVGGRASIKLHDKKKVTGNISQIGENDFVVTKEGTQQTIAYTDVAQIEKKSGKRVSTAGKIIIVLGALWAVGMISTGGGG